MALARMKEGFLLEVEAEMRTAGQTPDPRPMHDWTFNPTSTSKATMTGWRRTWSTTRDIWERLARFDTE